MAIHNARAIWEGDLKRGKGSVFLGEGGVELPFDFAARFGKGAGSNPEELIGGAHAGCYSMALAHELVLAGHPPTKIETIARVHLEKTGEGFSIPKIELETEADIPGIDDETFHRFAEDAKENCVVSRVLTGAEITLDAKLLSGQHA